VDVTCGEGVQQTRRVRGEFRRRVLCGTQLAADRAPDVRAVVPDDGTEAGREALIELVRPVHRAARAPDEQDRGVNRITKGLDASMSPVGSNDLAVNHAHLP
jgi:hypothetical protein